jgi:hypothetical protein
MYVSLPPWFIDSCRTKIAIVLVGSKTNLRTPKGSYRFPRIKIAHKNAGYKHENDAPSFKIIEALGSGGSPLLLLPRGPYTTFWTEDKLEKGRPVVE